MFSKKTRKRTSTRAAQRNAGWVRPDRLRTLGVVAILVCTSEACSVDKDWSRAADDLWSVASNWTPNGTPSPFDDVYLGRNPFAQGFLTTLDVDDTVGSLTVTGESSLATNGHQLIVDGIVSLDGTNSVVTIDPRTMGDLDGLDVEGLVVENGAAVILDGGILELESGTIANWSGSDNSGGVGGFGTIELIESGLGGAQVLVNSGRLFVGRGFFDPSSVTLKITNTDTANPATIGDGKIDLDGDIETGIVDVDDGTGLLSGNLTLLVEAELQDPFNTQMLIGRGDTVDIRSDWKLQAGGAIELNGHTGTATVAGSKLTMSSPLATVNVNSGTGLFSSDLDLVTGAINVGPNSTLHLDGETNIDVASAIKLNTATSALRVTGNTSIAHQFGTFDWDGADDSSVTTVAGNGHLAIDVAKIDQDDAFHGTLNLNDGGDLTVNVGPPGTFFVGGTLNKNNFGTSTVSGSDLFLTGDVQVNGGSLVFDSRIESIAGAFNVATGAQALLQADHEFSSNAIVDVDGALELNGPTTWDGPSSVTGAGTIFNNGGATITGDTTIQVDTFVWDGGDTLILPGASLTLDVANIDEGNDTFQSRQITVRSGALNVDVADDEWELRFGTIELNKTTGQTPQLGGDRVSLQGGDIHIDGDAVIDAPVTIAGGAEIALTSDGVLQLNGGTLADPNRIEGGMITGGLGRVVTAAPNRALHGYGLVSVEADFDSTFELLADDGVLQVITVAGQFGRLGTADVDGVLEILNSQWSTSQAQAVVMNGGVLTGGRINNDGANGIRGHGLISSHLDNETSIDADGGTLVLTHDLNGYSGFSDNGQLNAAMGNLELRGSSGQGVRFFGGQATVSAGNEIYTNGRGFFFEDLGHLSLEQGTWRSNARTVFDASLSVLPGGPSTLAVSAEVDFRPENATFLDDDLRLDNDLTRIWAGARFLRSGALDNLAGSTLQLDDGADVGVTVHNQGLLTLGEGAAQAAVADFVQTSTGLLSIDLLWTGSTEFDQLAVSGGASLAGTLEVMLDGLVPGPGNEFTFLTASGGINGTFETEILPAPGPGLGFEVIYTTNQVSLLVVDQPIVTPDFNADGAVDGIDIDALVLEIVNMTNSSTFDLTGDGVVDHDDLDEWLVAAGAINLPSGNPYLVGDATLDGHVNGLDFVAWNDNKFTAQAAWTKGDFNADGTINGPDFVAWNSYKFMSSDTQVPPAVPEPTGWMLAILAGISALYQRGTR